MGLHALDTEVESKLKSAKRVERKRVAAAKDVLDPALKGCEVCPLRAQWPTILSSKMSMTGARDADLFVVGEAPGADEDELGEQFIGKSGKLLRSQIPARFRSRMAFQNAVRCRPKDNKTPGSREVHACSDHLAADADSLPLRAILGVGSVPLRHFLGVSNASITNIHGVKFPVQIGKQLVWYFPILHPAYVLRMGQDSFNNPTQPVFENDVRNFFKKVDDWPDPKIHDISIKDVVCAYDEHTARTIYGRMQEPIAIDIETPGLQPFKDSRILTAALSDGQHTVAFSIDHPESVNQWGWALLREVATTKRWIAHNAAFELLWIWFRIGVENWNPGPFEDTMAQARIFHKREKLLSLAVLTRIHLGCNVKSFSTIDVEHILDYPLSDVLPYNGLDALGSALLFNEKLKLNSKDDRWQVEKLLGTIKSTTAMQLKGLPRDEHASRVLQQHFSGLMRQAQEEANATYEARQFELEAQTHFNVASLDHVGTALVKYGKCALPKNEKKGYKTDDEALAEFAAGNPLAESIRRYREYAKLLSTYIDPILHEAVAPDGNIHPGYTTMMTATLRLSGEFHNIQNWPKRKHREVRRQIRAPKGHVMVAIDYGQLEARVIAMASGCPNLCKAIISGYDIHSDWRDRLIQIYPDYLDRLRHKSGESDEKKLLKAGRDNIKNDFVFASFFGSTPKGMAKYTGVPQHIMEQLSGDFWEVFSGVRKWVKGQRALYKATGATNTLTGRTRYSILWGNEPINTPIQGTAADIVLTAQNEITELALQEREPYLLPRINVHDDLTFIWPDDDGLIEHYAGIVSKIMVKRRWNWQIVPLTVEISLGDNWCDLTEVTTITGKYHK